MKINHKFLSIPPFISTSWKNVSTLQLDQSGTLIIHLKDGKEVKAPGLQHVVIEAVFAAYEKFLESEKTREEGQQMISFGLPMKMGVAGIESMLPFLQHNPAQADMPNFPPDLLQHISALAKVLNLENMELPKAEPHCNCPHCQIMRTFANCAKEEEQLLEEEENVSDEDLHFNEWKIEKASDHLYVLTNPSNPNETFNVFLGEPMGCTCGQSRCDHIRAVLKS